jgi:acetyl esterase/lipase
MKTNIAPAARIVLFVLSCLVLLLGLVRLLAPELVAISQAFGALFIAATLANAAGAVLERGRHKMALTYLWFTGMGLLILPLALYLRTGHESDVPAVVGDFIIFGSLALGALLSLPLKRAAKADGDVPAEKTSAARAAFRLAGSIAVIGISIALLLAQVAAVSRKDPGFFGVFWGQILPQAGLAGVVIGALGLRGIARFGKARQVTWIAVLPGAAAFVLGLVPLIQTPGVIARTDEAFRAGFGTAPAAVAGSGFSPVPLDLGALFLGSSAPDVREEKDVAYLTETAANGKTYTFRFDHYGPRDPGRHPALIRIHGGAWVLGDKGFSNGNFINLRFAALGYEVFDLQYGLNDKAKFEMVGLPPGPLQGPFGIDDMVRQLSSFTSYLADHAETLQADTSRVFVSGSSAGGQLAMALVLAGTSGYRDKHPGLGFDQRLTLRGVVPFYPAVAGDALGIPGDPAVIDTRPLFSLRNPPALCYQGGLDALVDADKVRDYARAYREAGPAGFVTVEFPVAGHGSDLLYWDAFNQVFVYYMERFLALESGK